MATAPRRAPRARAVTTLVMFGMFALWLEGLGQLLESGKHTKVCAGRWDSLLCERALELAALTQSGTPCATPARIYRASGASLASM